MSLETKTHKITKIGDSVWLSLFKCSLRGCTPLPSAGLSVIRFSRKNRMSSMSSKEIKYSLHCDDVRGNTDEGGLDYKRRHFYTLLTSVFVCTTLDAVTSLSSRQQCKNACKHSVTVKTVCGISLSDGRKLEESEGYNFLSLVIWSTLQLTSKQWFIT